MQLTEQYKGLVSHWFWGDSVLEWIRQCEITFESEGTLRKLLHPDVWPHASRASFVELLREKAVPTGGVALERAVGLRLTFRQPPPIDCFSSQFLFYLNSTVADTAYQTWSHDAGAVSAGALPLRRAEHQLAERCKFGRKHPVHCRTGLSQLPALAEVRLQVLVRRTVVTELLLRRVPVQLAFHFHGDHA